MAYNYNPNFSKHMGINKSNIKIGGGWGQVINPISSFNKYNKKNLQMGGGWGDNKVSFFGLFENN